MEHGNYVIHGEVADHFRAVSGALVDLQIAKRMIARCVIDREDGEEDDLEEAFWTTSLIRFRRAFAKGRGFDWGHRGLLANLSPELRASYERFYMLADKFIAHGVGVGEDLAATAVLGPGVGDSVIVYGGTVRKTRVSSPGTDLAKELLTLLAELVPLVAAREDIVHREFIEAIRTWPPADLLRGGRYESATHFDDTSALYRRVMKGYRRERAE